MLTDVKHRLKSQLLPVKGVWSVWYVRKQASKSFNVGPVGIRYIGYLENNIKERKSTQNIITTTIYLINLTMPQTSNWLAINHNFSVT